MIKDHPHYKELKRTLDSFLRWPPAKWDSDRFRTAYYAAQIEYFTGQFPSELLNTVKAIGKNWPFVTDNHQLTRVHIPTMCKAAGLSETVRELLIGPLQWCEGKMLSSEILSTGIAVGLQAITMIRKVLYGDVGIIHTGFGKDPTQWGLPQIFRDCIDDYGLLRPHPAGFNHWAWSQRPALVWLVERLGYPLTAVERDKWEKFYYLPCKMLLPGGKTFTIPNVNDGYGMNPVMGPVDSWVGYSEMDMWARTKARTYESINFDWLTVPADSGYVPPERPEGCSGRRDFGRLIVDDTEVRYLNDGDWVLTGGHKAGKEVVIKV